MVRKLEETEAAGAPERHHGTSCHIGLDPHILEQSGGCGNKVVTLLPYSPLHLLQELSTLPPLTFGTECLVWGKGCPCSVECEQYCILSSLFNAPSCHVCICVGAFICAHMCAGTHVCVSACESVSVPEMNTIFLNYPSPSFLRQGPPIQRDCLASKPQRSSLLPLQTGDYKHVLMCPNI